MRPFNGGQTGLDNFIPQGGDEHTVCNLGYRVWHVFKERKSL